MKFLVSIVLGAGLFAVSRAASAAEYYVATTGSDTAAGSEGAPWATFAHAESVLTAGDTAYFRAGTYAYTAGTSTCSSDTATINAVELTKSGSAGKLITYAAYAGETPVFDFSGIKDSCRITGIRVTGSYIHLLGLEIQGVPQNNTANHESWGVWNSGSNNVFELLNLHDNMGPGLFISDGGDNLLLNCDSHDNFDPNSSTGPGTNADGFGCHIGASGKNNVIRGCRSWFNSDDGYDLIQAQVPVTIENSWAFDNGYLSGTTTASGGDGNGFKGGGYGSPPTHVPTTPPQHTIQNCVSFRNRASGFYANHHPVANYWYNNTAYDNKTADFNMLGLDGSTAINVGILRNNIAFTGTLLANGTGDMVDDQFNSWDTSLGVTVSAADFQSIEVTGWDAPRQADGSLPVLTSFHLASGSDLIDKGTDVGLPYAGAKPDLGAFETGLAASGGGMSSGGASAGAGRSGVALGGGAGRATMTGGAGVETALGGMSSGGMTSGGAANGGAGATAPDGGGTKGTTANGGSALSGGATSSGAGGSTSNGANPGTGTAGNGASGHAGTPLSAGGTSDGGDAKSNDTSGCGCRVSGRTAHANAAWLLACVAVFVRRRRVRARV